MYHFIRYTLNIPFYDGKEALDTSIQRIYDAIRKREITNVLKDIFIDVNFSL